jgi:hypothetical protein
MPSWDHGSQERFIVSLRMPCFELIFDSGSGYVMIMIIVVVVYGSVVVRLDGVEVTLTVTHLVRWTVSMMEEKMLLSL